MLRALAELVLELREPLRAAVLLRYYEGLSTEEAAHRLGTTPATVRSHVQRGLHDLRERARRRCGDRTLLVLLAPLLAAPRLRAPLRPARSFPTAAAVTGAAAAGLMALTVAWTPTAERPEAVAPLRLDVAVAPLEALDVAASARRPGPPAEATAPVELALRAHGDGVPLSDFLLRVEHPASGAHEELRTDARGRARTALLLPAGEVRIVPIDHAELSSNAPDAPLRLMPGAGEPVVLHHDPAALDGPLELALYAGPRYELDLSLPAGAAPTELQGVLSSREEYDLETAWTQPSCSTRAAAAASRARSRRSAGRASPGGRGSVSRSRPRSSAATRRGAWSCTTPRGSWRGRRWCTTRPATSRAPCAWPSSARGACGPGSWAARAACRGGSPAPTTRRRPALRASGPVARAWRRCSKVASPGALPPGVDAWDAAPWRGTFAIEAGRETPAGAEAGFGAVHAAVRGSVQCRGDVLGPHLRWRVVADGFVPLEGTGRDVQVLAPDRGRVRATLARGWGATLRARDPAGAPVPDVLVRADGEVLGSTGAGGEVAVARGRRPGHLAFERPGWRVRGAPAARRDPAGFLHVVLEPAP